MPDVLALVLLFQSALPPGEFWQMVTAGGTLVNIGTLCYYAGRTTRAVQEHERRLDAIDEVLLRKVNL